MKILTRMVSVDKSISEVVQTLKSSAYHFPAAKFNEYVFSMRCIKRRMGRHSTMMIVKGCILDNEDPTKVVLEIHANWDFFLGAAIIILGIMGLIYCLIAKIDRWIPCLGMTTLGILISGQTLLEGVELLDLLEHKLKRF